jgi:hypothetical protein
VEQPLEAVGVGIVPRGHELLGDVSHRRGVGGQLMPPLAPPLTTSVWPVT